LYSEATVSTFDALTSFSVRIFSWVSKLL
jgi:hypothetical protein